MKFFRILPEMWASTSWPLGRATRNIVPGSTCVTVPMSSIGSSFATCRISDWKPFRRQPVDKPVNSRIWNQIGVRKGADIGDLEA